MCRKNVCCMYLLHILKEQSFHYQNCQMRVNKHSLSMLLNLQPATLLTVSSEKDDFLTTL